MSNYLCHEQPDLYDFDTRVVESRPGAVLLDRSARMDFDLPQVNNDLLRALALVPHRGPG